MNKIQMEQQINIAKEGIEVLDKWAETLDAEALEEKREQMDISIHAPRVRCDS